MAMMATTRREMEGPSYPWFLVVFLPLIAVAMQAYLPLRFPWFNTLNLPLLLVIYFSVTRRSPISGTFTGMVVGLLQDALTHRPLGINGITETVIGFLAASIGIKIEVENNGARALLNFVFALLYGFLYLLILRHLVGGGPELELVASAAESRHQYCRGHGAIRTARPHPAERIIMMRGGMRKSAPWSLERVPLVSFLRPGSTLDGRLCGGFEPMSQMRDLGHPVWGGTNAE